MFRGMGIPKNAANPNAARLFLDFVLSQKGQTVVGKGGLTPYRADVSDIGIAYTYQSIAAKVGEKNLIKVGFNKAMVEQAEAFARKWSATLAGR
jgi:iron(III) transport system substrate-binding protein